MPLGLLVSGSTTLNPIPIALSTWVEDKCAGWEILQVPKAWRREWSPGRGEGPGPQILCLQSGCGFLKGIWRHPSPALSPIQTEDRLSGEGSRCSGRRWWTLTEGCRGESQNAGETWQPTGESALRQVQIDPASLQSHLPAELQTLKNVPSLCPSHLSLGMCTKEK